MDDNDLYDDRPRCRGCGNPLTDRERAAYRAVCEDCFANFAAKYHSTDNVMTVDGDDRVFRTPAINHHE